MARLIEIEREILQVVARHREILDEEAPVAARHLERPPTSPPQGEPTPEAAFALAYDHVAQGLDRIVEALLSNRHDSPPGSLLDVRA